MKITVDVAEPDLRDACRFTGERKKGPAILKLALKALNLERRAEMAQKFISGEWGVELKGFEEARAADRAKARRNAARWRK